jgi:ABC-type Fe3+-hydroxamate transport system substrate-binding protein
MGFMKELCLLNIMMRGKYQKIFLSLCVSLTILLCTASSLYPSSRPRRIISLVPNITEELYDLGVQDRLIGVTTYCQRPPEAQSKERVGAVVEVNVEKVINLQPDLIIASPLTDHKQIEKLREVGLTVEIFPRTHDFKGLCAEFLRLGRLVGAEHKARAIVKRAEQKVTGIAAGAQKLPAPRVFVQIGTRPLVAVGNDSFLDDCVSFAGGVNIAHDVKTSVYSREEVVRKDPDIILVAQMGLTGEEEKRGWMKYKAIKAVQEGRIYVIDPYRFCSPTPLSFIESVQELARLFHGSV